MQKYENKLAWSRIVQGRIWIVSQMIQKSHKFLDLWVLMLFLSTLGTFCSEMVPAMNNDTEFRATHCSFAGRAILAQLVYSHGCNSVWLNTLSVTNVHTVFKLESAELSFWSGFDSIGWFLSDPQSHQQNDKVRAEQHVDGISTPTSELIIYGKFLQSQRQFYVLRMI